VIVLLIILLVVLFLMNANLKLFDRANKENITSILSDLFKA